MKVFTFRIKVREVDGPAELEIDGVRGYDVNQAEEEAMAHARAAGFRQPFKVEKSVLTGTEFEVRPKPPPPSAPPNSGMRTRGG